MSYIHLSDVPALILAGGKGTRLHPITSKCSKVMVEVSGKPFIHYLLEMLHRRGIYRVILSVGHFGKQIETYVGNGARFGLNIKYVYDSSSKKTGLSGTAGAVRGALNLLEAYFFVINGDTYLDIDYRAVFENYRKSNLDGLMVVYENHNHWWASNVALANGLISAYNKTKTTMLMQHIDTGVAILQTKIFKESSISDLSVVYEQLVAQQRLAAYEVCNRFYEINTPDSLNETTQYLKKYHST